MPEIIQINSAYAGTCILVFITLGTSISMKLDSVRYLRDRILLKFGLGRSFVDFYYKLSPGLCKINQNKSIKKIRIQVRYP